MRQETRKLLAYLIFVSVGLALAAMAIQPIAHWMIAAWLGNPDALRVLQFLGGGISLGLMVVALVWAAKTVDEEDEEDE